MSVVFAVQDPVIEAKFPPVALILFSVIIAVVGVLVGTPLSYVGTLVAMLALILVVKTSRVETRRGMAVSRILDEDERNRVRS